MATEMHPTRRDVMAGAIVMARRYDNHHTGADDLAVVIIVRQFSLALSWATGAQRQCDARILDVHAPLWETNPRR